MCLKLGSEAMGAGKAAGPGPQPTRHVDHLADEIQPRLFGLQGLGG